MVYRTKGSYLLGYFVLAFCPLIMVSNRIDTLNIIDIILVAIATILLTVHFILRLKDTINEHKTGELPKGKFFKDGILSIGMGVFMLSASFHSFGRINFAGMVAVSALILMPFVIWFTKRAKLSTALEESYISRVELENRISKLIGMNLSKSKLLILSKQHNCGLGSNMDRTLLITFREVDNTVKGGIFLLNTMEWSVNKVRDYDLKNREVSISSSVFDSVSYVVLNGMKIGQYVNQSGNDIHTECMYNNYGIYYYTQKDEFEEFCDLVELYTGK